MMTDAAPLLQIHRLVKRHGERLLLDVQEWSLAPSSATVLTGANGAGKSTLLRILAGLEPAERAEITIDGVRCDLRDYPPALREKIVYVHQHPVMFSMSVFENVAYGLRRRGLRGAALTAPVEAALAWAGIAHWSARSPQGLSGGEKQRVALARAQVLQPKLLLLDEPTANLDGAAREQVIRLIPQLRAAGQSVLIVCHDRDLIAIPGVSRVKLRDGVLSAR